MVFPRFKHDLIPQCVGRSFKTITYLAFYLYSSLLSPSRDKCSCSTAAGVELVSCDREARWSTSKKKYTGNTRTERPTQHRGIHSTSGAKLDHDLQSEGETVLKLNLTRLWEHTPDNCHFPFIRDSHVATWSLLTCSAWTSVYTVAIAWVYFKYLKYLFRNCI